MYSSKNGCKRHSSTVILLSGLKHSILVKRSESSGVMLGNKLIHFCFDLFGRDLIYLMASLFPMYFISSVEGVPKTEIILCTWSKKSSPGKRGVLPSSSAIMHPMDQISIALEYSLAFRITSGALYHLVTTYSVFYSSSWTKPLARPKSQIFTSHYLVRRRFEGFKSRWITLAECMQAKPLSIWTTKYLIWSRESSCFE